MAKVTSNFCGLDCADVLDLKTTLYSARANGYSFVCVPLIHERYRRELLSGVTKEELSHFTWSDTILNSNDWTDAVVGKLFDCSDCDSTDLVLRKQAEFGFHQQVEYARHLGLSMIVMRINGPNIHNLARLVHHKAYMQDVQFRPVLTSFCVIMASLPKRKIALMLETIMYLCDSMRYSIHCPMVSDCDNAAGFRNDTSSSQPTDTWKWWRTFYELCDSLSNVDLYLELCSELPDDLVLERWLGEPLKCVVLPTSIFLTNAKGFPTLTRRHQQFLKRCSVLGVYSVVQGPNLHKSIVHYMQYIQYLYQNAEVMFSRKHNDVLIPPQHFLKANIHANLYDSYEMDKKKYAVYRLAIELAIKDKMKQPSEATTLPISIVIVGAGRGPLVEATVRAATKLKAKIQIFAIEKNPNVIPSLLDKTIEESWPCSVIEADIRNWEPPSKVDIIISELLGSWGDDELSPECLDSAVRHLKSDGVCIPSSYTSYVTPISSSKLHNNAMNWQQPIVFQRKSSLLEKMYLVHAVNVFSVCLPEPVFTFNHPKLDNDLGNDRHASVTFTSPIDFSMHGFIGCFEAVLYGTVSIGTHPDRISKGVFRWLPLYIPIRNSISVHKGDTIKAEFWRRSDSHNVWYEWCVTEPDISPVHNIGGQHFKINLGK